MNKPALAVLLVFIFFSATGASIIDQETKQGIGNLHQKLDRLVEQEQAHHAQQLQLLKDQTEEIRLLKRKIQLQPLTLPAAPSVSEVPAPVLVPIPTPPPPVSVPIAPALAVVALPSPAPEALQAPSTEHLRNTESMSLLALLASASTVLFLIALMIWLRKRENDLRKFLLQGEMTALREELLTGRGSRSNPNSPMNPHNPKIHATGSLIK